MAKSFDNDYGERRRPEHYEICLAAPRIKLLRDVRRTLWLYLRCRPHRDDQTWRITWEWAHSCACRNSLLGIVPKAARQRWPAPAEIATQYLVLAIADMKSSHLLRLPHRAAEYAPARVADRFAAIQPRLNRAEQLPLLESIGDP